MRASARLWKMQRMDYQADRFMDIAARLNAQGEVLFHALLATATLLLFTALVSVWALLLARKTRDQLEEVKRASEVDDLTGTLRRGAGERYARMATRMFPCVVAFVDVNDLGKTNKDDGHAAGDALLRKVAAGLLTAFARAHDVVFRYGGDEFVLFLPAIDGDPLAQGGEEPSARDPLDAMLTYALHQLEELSENGTLFTFALSTTRLHPPSDVLAVVDEEVREVKRRRRELHTASIASEPTTHEE